MCAVCAGRSRFAWATASASSASASTGPRRTWQARARARAPRRSPCACLPSSRRRSTRPSLRQTASLGVGTPKAAKASPFRPAKPCRFPSRFSLPPRVPEAVPEQPAKRLLPLLEGSQDRREVQSPESRFQDLCHAPEGFLGWCPPCCVSDAMEGFARLELGSTDPSLRSEGRAELVRKTTKWRSGPGGSRRPVKDLQSIPFLSPEAPRTERPAVLLPASRFALSFSSAFLRRFRAAAAEAASALRSSLRGSEGFGSGSRVWAGAVSSPRKSSPSPGKSTR